jgi:hypothetical protein
VLRFTPEESRIDLSTEVGNDQLVMTITGWLPRPKSSGDAGIAHSQEVAQALADLAFGERLLRQIIVGLHQGTFTIHPQTSDIAVFTIGLPLDKGGRHET